MKTLIALILLSFGCSTPAEMHPDLTGGWWTGTPLAQHYEQVAINIDSSMEPYAGIVLEGAQAWRSFGVDFLVDESEKRTIRCADETQFSDGIFGWTDGTGIRFRCSELAQVLAGQSSNEDIRFQEQKVIAAAHEFGHYLGLEHVQDEGAVMNASIGPSTQESFHESDIIEFYKVLGN